MKQIFIFQHTNSNGNNRLVDRIVENQKDGHDWVRKVYPWAKDWFFARNPDGSYPFGFEPMDNSIGWYYMIGKDSNGSNSIVILIEKRNIHLV